MVRPGVRGLGELIGKFGMGRGLPAIARSALLEEFRSGVAQFGEDRPERLQRCPHRGIARREGGELLERGWRVSRGDIRRDVHRLLGGAYEEFLRKRL